MVLSVIIRGKCRRSRPGLCHDEPAGCGTLSRHRATQLIRPMLAALNKVTFYDYPETGRLLLDLANVAEMVFLRELEHRQSDH